MLTSAGGIPPVNRGCDTSLCDLASTGICGGAKDAETPLVGCCGPVLSSLVLGEATFGALYFC